MTRTIFALMLATILCTGCDRPVPPPVKIAINPWPGYEALYLAEQKGFFDQVGLNLTLVQLGSLSDVQTAYINKQVDGMASTAIEAVQANYLGGDPLTIIAIPDYSNGGDMIIAPKSISGINQLKGKKVGAEISSLGIFVLSRALQKSGLQLSDIDIINIEQIEGDALLKSNEIDAFVTYPPYSINALEGGNTHIIFSSAEIPNEIVDVVVITTDILKQDPDFGKKLRTAWQMALDYIEQNPNDAYRIMADRESITPEEFKAALQDLKLLTKDEQEDFMKQRTLFHDMLVDVCQTLVYAKSITKDCSEQPNLVEAIH